MPFFNKGDPKEQSNDTKSREDLPNPEDISLDSFDFVRFTYADVNGISRGRTIPQRNLAQFIDNGFGIYIGIPWITHVSENSDGLIGGAEIGWPNVTVRPDVRTLYALPWAGTNQETVGAMLCEAYNPCDKSPRLDCPRIIARRQLERLERLGHTLYSAFECEMMIYNPETNKMLWNSKSFCKTLEMAKAEKFLFEIDKLVSQAGVNVESYQAEYEPGQVEMPIKPQFGIESADQAFKLRNAMTEICEQRGYTASFFTKPSAEMICNGFHFNHSICTINGGQNTFKGSGNDVRSVSDTFSHWMAGLIKHSPALCAFCAPSVNCYRRYHKPWAPHKIDWGFDNRFSCFRVKISFDSPPYIECRLPSSFCNPYLVMAAVVAAGLDGIRTGTYQCPPQMDPKAAELPHNLEEALKALEEDEVLVSAFGSEFVKNYVQVRSTEIERLSGSDMEKDDQAMIDKELSVYGEKGVAKHSTN